MPGQPPQQAPSVVVPTRIPLVTEPANRDESTAKDARLVNAYAEKNTKTEEYQIFKRPGLEQNSWDTHVAAGNGVYNWNGNIYAIFGTTLYKDDVSIGTVDGTGGVYQFNATLGSTPRLQLGNGVKAYNWDDSTLEQMEGGNFPGNTYTDGLVKGWAYLDGTTYVLDTDGYIHGSDVVAGLNRPDLWNHLVNLLGAQIEPDKGVAIAKQLVYVIVLKEWSTEVFYDAQNTTGSPLGPVQGAKVNYGCVSADTVQELDGSLFWVGTNRASGAQVIQLTKLTAEIISSKPIERILSDASFTSVAGFAFKHEGHRFYGFTLKGASDNITLVYDLAERLWSQWTDVDGNYLKWSSTTYLEGTGRIIQHESNGKLYTIDSSNTEDDGEVITVDIYTPNWDGGTRRRKHQNMLEFVGDQTEGSVLQVRFNDYDYDSTKWTNYRTVNMGLVKPILTNNGTFVRRATHIRHQSNTRMRLQAIENQVDLGVL
jgi:hypothetical protein